MVLLRMSRNRAMACAGVAAFLYDIGITVNSGTNVVWKLKCLISRVKDTHKVENRLQSVVAAFVLHVIPKPVSVDNASKFSRCIKKLVSV